MSARKAFPATVVVSLPQEAIVEGICDRLVEEGFAPLSATSASTTGRLLRFAGAEALVLDLDLPGALDLLRERGSPGLPEVPVIALIDRDQDAGVLTDDPALRVDDYLRRPVGFEDLRRSLTTILRRRHRRTEQPIRVGDLLVDPARQKVTVADRDVHVTRKELLLLRILASDPTRVHSKDELLRAVWGLRHPTGRTRTLDSHASRLRRKLDPEHRRFVVNAWGIGYRLVDSFGEAEPIPPCESEDR
ncbi:MAG TPA: response regulator transcription factor [Solirubrobacterales bacterium]